MQSATRQSSLDSYDSQRLYLDFDSFFATAEQHFNPYLRGRPVGVVPLDSPHTGCIAVSREAKALGLKSNISIREARKTVPDMIFVVARLDAYVRLHHRVLAVIENCLPIAKVRSIDEVVCHLLPSESQDASMLALRIKHALADNFSAGLTCSIGIASTELLAKIGVELNKPNGFTWLKMDELPGRLEHLKLTKLPGVSDGIEARLHAAGIRNFPALWHHGPKHLRSLWGSVEGERFWNGLHGQHFERPETVKRMFGHSRMLPGDWRTPEKVHECARQLTLSASRRLRRAKLKATKLTMSLRATRIGSQGDAGDKALNRWSCELPFSPAREDHTFLRVLGQAATLSQAEVSFRRRAVSIMIHDLSPEDEAQGNLFLRGPAGCQTGKAEDKQKKWELLSDALDQLRATHGPSAANVGPKVDLPGGYLGAKIAFGRIPALEDFSEAQSEDSATHFCSF